MSINKKYLYSKLTYKVLGVLFSVHNQLGNSYQEKYYQRATAIALSKEKIKFKKERKVDVLFQDKKIGHHSLDFLIEEKIVLEIKTIPKLRKKDINQALSYMNYLQKQVGLLANFRPEQLEYKRLILPKKYIKEE